MAKKKTWILVADGARARIFVNEGPGTGMRGLAGADYEADHRPTHEIGVERPGRTQESLGDGTRHAYAPRVDWHEYEKHLFAKEMAQVIDQACERGAFDALVLVAPPKALGELRAALGKNALAKVAAELDKDLVNTPEHDLPGHLTEAITL
jgi:protein required for attachment to host cells